MINKGVTSINTQLSDVHKLLKSNDLIPEINNDYEKVNVVKGILFSLCYIFFAYGAIFNTIKFSFMNCISLHRYPSSFMHDAILMMIG